MAIKLIANYAKRLGLPGYSSHQFSVSVETELTDVAQAAEESAKLYQLLQGSVDEQIKNTGFVPPVEYGINGSNGHANSNGHTHANGHSNGNGNGHANGYANGNGKTNGNGHRAPHADVGISEKQLDLIQRIVRDNNLNKNEVENLAVEMFGGGVRTLNRMQASNFIDELFERYPRQDTGSGYRRFPRTKEVR